MSSLFPLCYIGVVDIWAVGCIMAEMVRHKILFPGRDCILVVCLDCALFCASRAVSCLVSDYRPVILPHAHWDVCMYLSPLLHPHQCTLFLIYMCVCVCVLDFLFFICKIFGILIWLSFHFSVDVWSVGCIMAEMVRGSVLFPGTDRILTWSSLLSHSKCCLFLLFSYFTLDVCFVIDVRDLMKRRYNF